MSTRRNTNTDTQGVIDRSDAICIIGAGPAGLSAARTFAGLGIDYEQFERHTDVGGIWDIDNPGSPMYESAHFISSRDTSGFFDFPMPKHFGDYPKRTQILEYTRNFADTFGLRERITFDCSVEKVHADGETWIVTPLWGPPYASEGWSVQREPTGILAPHTIRAPSPEKSATLSLTAAPATSLASVS